MGYTDKTAVQLTARKIASSSATLLSGGNLSAAVSPLPHSGVLELSGHSATALIGPEAPQLPMISSF
jgi:hypothetical protein